MDDMNAVNNMRLLGGATDTKKSNMSSFTLKFDMHKVDVLYDMISSSTASFCLQMPLSDYLYLKRKNVQPEKNAPVKKKHGSCRAFIPW